MTAVLQKITPEGVIAALVELEKRGALDPVALILDDPDLSLDDFTDRCRFVGRLYNWSKFAVGDLCIFGEAVYGQDAYQAFLEIGMSPEGIQECIRVAMYVPRARRRAALSWSHHRLVAPKGISPEEQDELLDQAEAGGLSKGEFADVVRQFRDSKRGADSRSGPDERKEPPVVVEEAIGALRAVVLQAQPLGDGRHAVPTEAIARARAALGLEDD